FMIIARYGTPTRKGTALAATKPARASTGRRSQARSANQPATKAAGTKPRMKPKLGDSTEAGPPLNSANTGAPATPTSRSVSSAATGAQRGTDEDHAEGLPRDRHQGQRDGDLGEEGDDAGAGEHEARVLQARAVGGQGIGQDGAAGRDGDRGHGAPRGQGSVRDQTKPRPVLTQTAPRHRRPPARSQPRQLPRLGPRPPRARLPPLGPAGVAVLEQPHPDPRRRLAVEGV